MAPPPIFGGRPQPAVPVLLLLLVTAVLRAAAQCTVEAGGATFDLSAAHNGEYGSRLWAPQCGCLN